MGRKKDDWKNWKKGFPYKNGINSKQYKNDRKALEIKHGNGWWCNDGKGWSMKWETHVEYQKRRRSR